MNRTKAVKKTLSFLLCVVMVFVCLPQLQANATTLTSSIVMEQDDQQAYDDLTANYEELQKKIEQLEKEQAQLKKDSSNAQKALNNVKEQIKSTEKQLDILDKEITSLNKSLDDLSLSLGVVEGVISENLDMFKQRIRSIYMNGRISEIDMLLSADNFLDLLTRAEILRRISEKNNSMIDLLLDNKTELESIISQQQALKAQTESKSQDMDGKRKELGNKYSESETLLSEIKADQTQTAAELKKYNEEIEEVNREIAEIIANYVSAEEYVGGTFAWPLPLFTKITSPYGMRKGKMHTGTDIAGRNAAGDLCYGYDIVAANSGTVIAVRDAGNKSYGKYLIIDHGGGCRSLYAHASKITVKEGDVVVKGAPIAKAGTTGNSTGYHLHFELWINDTRVNPMDHLVVPTY